MPKKILVSRQQKYEQTSVRGQASCIINDLKEFHQSLLNSKGDKSLHLEKVGGWRRLCIYIYSQLDKCSGHLGVNLLTKGIKQNENYGQRMEHGHQRWGSFWDFYCLHHLDSGHNHGNKKAVLENLQEYMFSHFQPWKNLRLFWLLNSGG